MKSQKNQKRDNNFLKNNAASRSQKADFVHIFFEKLSKYGLDPFRDLDPETELKLLLSRNGTAIHRNCSTTLSNVYLVKEKFTANYRTL